MNYGPSPTTGPYTTFLYCLYPVLESLHKQEWIVVDTFPHVLCNLPMHLCLCPSFFGLRLTDNICALRIYLYDFSHCHGKILCKGNLRKKVFILSHSLRVHDIIMVGKTRRQKHGAAGQMTSVARRQIEIHVGALLVSSCLFTPGPEPMERCSTHLGGRVFPF